VSVSKPLKYGPGGASAAAHGAAAKAAATANIVVMFGILIEKILYKFAQGPNAACGLCGFPSG
jgi:hypothetical protein